MELRCSAVKRKVAWHRMLANNYFNHLNLESAQSGILTQILHISNIAKSCDINFEHLLELIAENNSIRLSRKCQDVINRKIHLIKVPASETSLRSNKRNLKNIAITGGEFAPSFGIEGEILSGIKAAEGIIERLRR